MASAHLEGFIDLRDDLFLIQLDEAHTTRFDLEGRWFSAQRGSRSFRRGMDGRISVRPRAERGALLQRQATLLSQEEGALLTASIRKESAEALELWRDSRLPLLRSAPPDSVEALFDRIDGWDATRYDQHVTECRSLYGHIPVLPPDRYLALYVQVMRGCGYNRCRFCNLYHEIDAQIPSRESWEAYLDRLDHLFGEGMRLRRGIFLGDANALELEPEELLARLRQLTDRFPLLQAPGTISGFCDTFNARYRTIEHFAPLARHGLKRLYIGLETGYDPLRRVIAKPGRAVQVAQRLSAMKAAGISLGIMVIVGIGGKRYSPGHLEATVQMLHGCKLDREDVIFLSRLELQPDGASEALAEAIGLPGPEQIEAEEAAFRQALPAGVPIAHYALSGFVY